MPDLALAPLHVVVGLLSMIEVRVAAAAEAELRLSGAKPTLSHDRTFASH